MITEDYVSFDTAKLLKEKGFDKYPLFPCYREDDSKLLIDIPTTLDTINYHFIPAPTIQMAMKWLREVHNISVEPLVDFGSGDEYWWTADIGYIKKDGLIDELCGYNSYEETAESAIKYCLENLI